MNEPFRLNNSNSPYGFSNNFNGVVFSSYASFFVGEAGDEMFIGGVKPRSERHMGNCCLNNGLVNEVTAIQRYSASVGSNKH